NGFAHDVMVPSWRDQARGNSGSRDDRLTFSCQCHLGEQLQQYAAVSIKPMRDGSVDFTVKGSTKGAIKGAITGAGIGAKGGIPGAVAGTIIGGTIGYITGPAD
ncbi:hypothetical protein ACB268_21050, partial [Aeromonas sanarellii]